MLKAIVFDFDGVIVDSEPLHYRAFLRVARQFDLDFDYDTYIRDYVGYDDRDAFRVMLEQVGRHDAARDGRTVQRLADEKATAFEAVVNDGVQAIAGAPILVEQAAAAMPIAIASGATRRDIELILDRLELQRHFPVIVSADDVQQSKPNPATYRMAVEQLALRHPEQALSAAQCLSIEDTAAGIESARGAGLLTLGLNSLGRPDQLQRAHRTVQTLENLTLQTLHEWFD